MSLLTSFSRLVSVPRAIVGVLTLFALVAGSTPAPARADGAASTRNIVLGAAAAVAAVVIYNNVHHKQVARDTIVGRTRDGGVVYGDGRIVYPNGNVLYTSNGDGRVCSYGDVYGERCGTRPVAYHPSGEYAERHSGRHYRRHERGDEGRGHREHGEHERGHDEGGD